MGSSRSGRELGRKLDRVAEDLEDLPLAAVKDGSQIVKASVLRYAPARLSGVGRRGARLNARYNVGNYGGEAKSRVFAVGPWQLVENDTRAHQVPKQRGGRARRRYAVIPGVGVRAYAKHPGTRGKRPWARGVEAALPKVRNLLSTRGGALLRRIF